MTAPLDPRAIRERLVDELHATHCAGDIDAETCNCDVWHARRAIVDAFDAGWGACLGAMRQQLKRYPR